MLSLYFRYSMAMIFSLMSLIMQVSASPIKPIEPISFLEKEANIGELLFFDSLLSKDNSMSCASCHNISHFYGADGKSLPTGINKEQGKRNTPTVYNAALNYLLNWDGSALTLEKQAETAISMELEINFDDLISKISNSKKYSPLFKTAFQGRVNKRTITKSLAEFQKKLLTLNSPFDRYLRGDHQAISEKAIIGYQKFKSYGCSGCHQGANVGGNLLQKFGIHSNPRSDGFTSNDLGRFLVTNIDKDRYVFRVPSLRLAIHTAPYFHDGSVPTIEKAVELMFLYQVGRKININDRDHIIEFLKTLPGELYKQEKFK